MMGITRSVPSIWFYQSENDEG